MVQKTRPQAETLSGSPQPNFTGYSVNPIISKRTPTANDTGYPLGQVWVDKSNDSYWALTSVSAGVATWQVLGAGGGSIATINLQPPIAGNFNIVGTANQIAVTPGAGQDTLSVTSPFIAPGSITATSTITAGTGITSTTGDIDATAGTLRSGNGIVTTGNVALTNGNLSMQTAGNKFNIATGANASVGISAAMIGGTTTVATTAVTASSLIFLTVDVQDLANAGQISAPTVSIVPGVSFVINSSNGADTSTVKWWIIN